MIQPTRIHVLKDEPANAEGAYVLYWMGLSQRARFNPALEYAIDEANRLKRPVVVCYGIAEGYPDVNARHWTFLLQGVAEIGPELEARGIAFVARREGGPVDTALRWAQEAALVVCDRNYLAPIRRFYADLARRAPCRVVQVEGDVVVPVETASGKHEYAARTIRPKINRLMDAYIVPLEARAVRHKAGELPAKLRERVQHDSTLALADIPKLVAGMKCDQGVRPVKRFTGGHSEAERRLKHFLGKLFDDYASVRGKPEAGAASHMSPYLHFGQISPVAIALAVREATHGSSDDKASFLEEMIVRRELAINHVFYTENYDKYACLPEWPRKTLAEQAGERRPHLYSIEQFERGETHDIYWNAGMSEMRETGYMHNHMRMYWGKKILEWSRSPEEAWDTTLTLNNRYFLDGRDSNSFTNVAWLFGLHDRPWGRRPVYGTVRSMGLASLKKFDADAYVKEVERLVLAEQA